MSRLEYFLHGFVFVAAATLTALGVGMDSHLSNQRIAVSTATYAFIAWGAFINKSSAMRDGTKAAELDAALTPDAKQNLATGA